MHPTILIISIQGRSNTPPPTNRPILCNRTSAHSSDNLHFLSNYILPQSHKPPTQTVWGTTGESKPWKYYDFLVPMRF